VPVVEARAVEVEVADPPLGVLEHAQHHLIPASRKWPVCHQEKKKESTPRASPPASSRTAPSSAGGQGGGGPGRPSATSPIQAGQVGSFVFFVINCPRISEYCKTGHMIRVHRLLVASLGCTHRSEVRVGAQGLSQRLGRLGGQLKVVDQQAGRLGLTIKQRDRLPCMAVNTSDVHRAQSGGGVYLGEGGTHVSGGGGGDSGDAQSW
jgi:hypothetical protein